MVTVVQWNLMRDIFVRYFNPITPMQGGHINVYFETGQKTTNCRSISDFKSSTKM